KGRRDRPGRIVGPRVLRAIVAQSQERDQRCRESEPYIEETADAGPAGIEVGAEALALEEWKVLELGPVQETARTRILLDPPDPRGTLDRDAFGQAQPERNVLAAAQRGGSDESESPGAHIEHAAFAGDALAVVEQPYGVIHAPPRGAPPFLFVHSPIIGSA